MGPLRAFLEGPDRQLARTVKGLKTTLAQLIALTRSASPPTKSGSSPVTPTRCPYGWGNFSPARSLGDRRPAPASLPQRHCRERLPGGREPDIGRRPGPLTSKISDCRAFVRAPISVVRGGGNWRALPITRATAFRRSPNRAVGGWRPTTLTAPSRTPCHIAIVARVDIATGQVKIERFVIVEDAGRLITQ